MDPIKIDMEVDGFFKALGKFFKETPLGKGIVTIVRNAVLVMAGLIVANLITLLTGADIDPTMKILIIGVLKGVDELLHKTGIAENGITRF